MIRVIIVDDEVFAKKGIKEIICSRTKDYTIVGEASNGKEAIEIIRKLIPDVVITDIRMPKMNGLELIELIMRELPQIKIIIISGYDDFEYAQQALRLGAMDYILKPTRIKELLNILDKIRIAISEEREKLAGKVLNISDTDECCYRKVIGDALRYIHENYNGDLSLQQVADKINMNFSYFSKLFKSETGMNFTEYLTRIRIEKAKEYLKSSNMRVHEIANVIGYNDPKHFNMVFKKMVGLTPSEFRDLA